MHYFNRLYSTWAPIVALKKKRSRFTARLINYAHKLCHLEQQMVELREGEDPAYVFLSILLKLRGYSGPSWDNLGWEEEKVLGSSPNHLQIMFSCSRKAIPHI